MALDTAQTAAVRHFCGPAAVLAGPGSGKTTVITHRIKELIEKRGISPEKILVITFTRAAASEMKSRFLSITAAGGEVTFGTFHAVFFKILQQAHHYSAKDLVKPGQARELVRAQLSAAGVHVRDERAVIDAVLSELYTVKAAGTPVEAYEAVSCPSELFRIIYRRYQQMLEEEHLLDFEDMTLCTHSLLTRSREVLAALQDRFSFFLIDEFQDIAAAQYQIVKLLAGENGHLFIVGDDDQSIYGFRGTAPQIMQQFLKDYPQAAIYRLNVNYRSDAYIVTAANRLIRHNKERFEKDIRPSRPAGAQIERHAFADLAQESDFLAEEIYKQIRAHRQCAVLTRTHTGAAALQRRLVKKGIFIAAGNRDKDTGVFEHWITQDLVAYMEVAAGSRSRLDFLRIMNRPERKIHRRYFMQPEVDFSQVRDCMYMENAAPQADKLCQLEQDLETVRRLPAFAAVNFIRKGIGYDAYIQQTAEEQGIAESTLTDILERLQEHARLFQTAEQWTAAVRKIWNGSDTATASAAQEMKLPVQKVFFYTMHGAKGLEFDTVYLPDVNEGITPGAKAFSAAQIEEERRLFYVAMTRAKEKLVICSAQEHYNRMLQPSRFIRELCASGEDLFFDHTRRPEDEAESLSNRPPKIP